MQVSHHESPESSGRPDQAIRQRIQSAEDQIDRIVTGQRRLIRGMLVSLLCGGHVLIEGVPGLAKTTAVSTLAATIQTTFCRLQFTPDLLPSDILGSEVYRPEQQRFEIQRGPIFANLVLVDEINRAPAKVQSALLEAMQERQVSIAGESMPLPSPFMVLATQNPIDQQGTYALPEAQMDRFLMKLLVRYPEKAAEQAMLHRSLQPDDDAEPIRPLLAPEDITAAQRAIAEVSVSRSLQEYVLQLVQATRRASEFDSRLGAYVRFGVSPRGTLALAHSARAVAFLDGRQHVIPDDVKAVVKDVFRHRIVLSYEALADDQQVDDVIDALVPYVRVP